MILHNGSPHVIGIACADDEGTGGLYIWDGGSVTRIDDVNCCSLAVMGDRMYRLQWSPPGGDCTLRIYDADGNALDRKLDNHGDAHHITVAERELVVASTSTNSLLWLSAEGEILRTWSAGPGGDAWHINGASYVEGSLYVSAFGRFAAEREWDQYRRTGTGIVFELASGTDVITGLCCPHHPRRDRGSWIVCASVEHRVYVYPAGNGTPDVLQFHGWTRGLAISDDRLFVGISAPRHDSSGQTQRAAVAIVDRASHRTLQVIPVPALEIGDLCLIPESVYRRVAAAHGYENASASAFLTSCCKRF